MFLTSKSLILLRIVNPSLGLLVGIKQKKITDSKLSKNKLQYNCCAQPQERQRQNREHRKEVVRFTLVTGEGYSALLSLKWSKKKWAPTATGPKHYNLHSHLRYRTYGDRLVILRRMLCIYLEIRSLKKTILKFIDTLIGTVLNF